MVVTTSPNAERRKQAPPQASDSPDLLALLAFQREGSAVRLLARTFLRGKALIPTHLSDGSRRPVARR